MAWTQSKKIKKRVQILESVPQIVAAKTVATNKTPKRFFLKYPKGGIDIYGSKGQWYEVEKEDWLVSMPCEGCGHVVWLRVDTPVCTRCKWIWR